MKKSLCTLLVLPATLFLFAQSVSFGPDVAFNDFKGRFIEALWKANPGWATENGYHKWDSVLTVPNEASRTERRQWATRYLDSLNSYPLQHLDVANQTDWKLIQNQLKSAIWSIDTKKEYQWNPAQYNVTGGIAYMLSEPYDKLENRLRNIRFKLEKVAAYYDAAKAAISNPATVLKGLAIQQNEGGLPALQKDIVDSVKKSGLPQNEKKATLAAAAEAVTAINDYIEWLKALPETDARNFRLGKPLYDAEFTYDIESSLTADELYKAATDRKEYLTTEMAKKADTLWRKYFGNTTKPTDRYTLIRKVIDTVSATHVKPADFRSSIEKQIPKLAAFVRSKNLLYLDPSKPLKVRDEPGYMAGVAGASVSAPGPYDKGGKTYYNVGSLDGWAPQRAESYLREYNDYTMQILNIHEAIPGHYAQLVYANKSPDIIKAILGNGSMIEGWAVYSELMMMEAGYDPSPEMWLMYYKWNLRSVCNTILDISVHTRDMTKEAAMDLLVRQAFQQQAEAEGKWKRVSVSHVQLTSYFNGFYEILRLRDAWKAKMGAAYSVKDFNEKFLSYGSVPVKYISEMMLGGK